MRALLLAGVVVFGLSTVSARADVITTFTATGDFGFGGHPDLSGTVTIDTTVGSIVGASLATRSPIQGTYTNVSSAGYYSQSNGYAFFVSNNANIYLAILLPEASLVGYAGSPLASYTAPTATGYVSDYNDTYELISGSLTAVPEPAGIALLGVGGLGILAARWRRRAVGVA